MFFTKKSEKGSQSEIPKKKYAKRLTIKIIDIERTEEIFGRGGDG